MKCNTQHNDIQYSDTQNIAMLSVVYAKCHVYNLTILSVIILNVVMLSVMAPKNVTATLELEYLLVHYYMFRPVVV